MHCLTTPKRTNYFFLIVSVNFPRINKNRNPLLREPSEEITSKLRSVMKLDLEFYEFIKQRFLSTYSQLNFKKLQQHV